jgi:uncharacterized membrane protein
VVGYAVPNGLLQSEGWWTLAPNGDCKHVLSRSETVDYTTGYLYAHSSGRDVIASDQSLCVQHNKAFTIRRSDHCEGRNFQTVWARPIGFDLNKNWTTNITQSGGRVIFDDGP